MIEYEEERKMELEALRNRINEVDDEIVKLFVERMQTAAQIAGEKAEKNLNYMQTPFIILCLK